MKSPKKAVSAADRKNLPSDAKALIANARNDITIPFYSGALQHADDTLIQRGRGAGLKIYDEILRDPHAYAMLQKRKKHLIAREWEVEAASEKPLDTEAADFVQSVLKSLPFDRLCEDLAGGATLKGFSVAEVVWTRDGNRIVPDDIVSHDQRRFSFGEDWRPRLLTWTNMRDGEELPDRKFMVHRHDVVGNNPYGLGLGTRLFWAVLFKREGVAFWLHFLDKFAGPTVVASTPYGMLSDEQSKLLNTLASVRTSSAFTVPVGTDIKFLEAARSGAVSYQDWLAYWDKQISICVTGETLTTDIGPNGSRAAAETHADMLDLLVDGDADLLSDTLREQFLAWLVEYNFPGAGVPSVWRVRPSNEQSKAAARKAKAEAASAVNDALMAVLATAGEIDDDDDAREYITSFGLTDSLSDKAIDRLVDARFAFAEGGKRGRDMRQLAKGNPAFAALFGPLKKKVSDPVSFADDIDAAERLADQAEEAAERHFNRRLDAIRAALDDAADLAAAQASLLALAAKWSPDALASMLGEGLELAALQGREAVYLDGEGDPAEFADADVFNQPFKEQIKFFRQKRGKPTKAWTDPMRGTHDRAFVIAGVTDLAMLSDFQTALAEAMEKGTTLADFRQDFDRIVSRYGWQYKGQRGWRTRVIFETNMRTSYMAGRLQQMRDPDVLKLRPIWQYRHGETRSPKVPRPQHKAWHGLCLRHDDPFWDTHFPPNDWLCSCGVRSLSSRDLKRLGKEEPDVAPGELFEPITDPVSGKLIEQPQGIGYGWDYQPGHLWEQGLVPSFLMEQGAELLDASRMAVAIDAAEPIADLVKSAKPFKAELLKDGLEAEDYVRAFLSPFNADIGEAVLFEDVAGTKLPVSDLLFRNRNGEFKLTKRNRHRVMGLMAETLLDPDEIWMGVARKAESGDLVVDRRYIRVDPNTAIQIVFEIGEKWWDAVTSFDFTDKRGRADFSALDKRRVGKLVYKRPKSKRPGAIRPLRQSNCRDPSPGLVRLISAI